MTTTNQIPGLTVTPKTPPYNEFNNTSAFAVIKNDGSVVAWGDKDYGGDTSAVATQLNGTIDVTQIYSTFGAFAALRSDGSVVTWGSSSIGNSSFYDPSSKSYVSVAAQLNGTIDVTQIYSTDSAFAALRADGSVVTWGASYSGGDSSAIAAQLNGTIDVTAIYSNDKAFAALRSDGSVITWGNGNYGGDSSTVAKKLNGTIDVTQIFSNSISGHREEGAFVALRSDGSVITWGSSSYGGDSSTVANQLDGTIDVTQIISTGYTFAALRADGSVVIWGGDSSSGKDSSAVESQLTDVKQIFSTQFAFAALRADGSVVTWGYSEWGGDSSAVAAGLNGTIDVTTIYSTSGHYGAFAALRADGSVVTWGYSYDGGDSSVHYYYDSSKDYSVATQLDGTIDVTAIYSNYGAFAALRADGSVVTWGYEWYGGDSSAVAGKLNGTIDVTAIYSNGSAFAALRADGSVVTWGDSYYGGDSSAVAAGLNGTIDVTAIYSTSGGAFAALRSDGSVVTWGNNSSVAAGQLKLNGITDVTQIFSTEYSFAALRADGSVITWMGRFGGDSSAVASQLDGTIDVTQIFSNPWAFAALRTDGSVVTWGSSGGDSSAVASQLDGTIDVTQIFSNGFAFVALRADGSVVTWGGKWQSGDTYYNYGEDSSAVASQLDGTIDVTQIFSTDRAFAAIRTDGSVVTWGDSFSGGDSITVASQLDGTIDVTQIFSNSSAFAAIRTDGSVVTWGNSFSGGDSITVASQLDGTIDVTQIFSNSSAFAAIRTDGSVVTWGYSSYGGDSSAVANQLDGTIDVTQIFSSEGAFAALRADGSVVTWGNGSNDKANYDYGGDSSAVASKLDGTIDVTQIFSASRGYGAAFAALRADGSVVTWGNGYYADSGKEASQLNGDIDVIQIVSNIGTFAALRADGSVVTWGGDLKSSSSAVASQIDGTIDVTQIVSTGNSLGGSFAALRADGSVVVWGMKNYGGDIFPVAAQLNGDIDVIQIFSANGAFSALRADGSVITWGDANYGQDSRGVADQISSGVVSFANPATDDWYDATTPQNNAPTLTQSIAAQSATEGRAFSFTIPANTFADSDGDTLTYSATLTNGNALPSWLQFNSVSRAFSGTPPANTADLIIRVTAKDAGGLSASADFNFSTPAAPIISHVPMAESRTIIINEDTSYTIKVADFGFSDPNDKPAHSFTAVKIGNLPGFGKLSFNGNSVTYNQVITVNDIAAGKLIFTPAPNAHSNGLKYGSFTFKVQDNGSAGLNLALTESRMTFNVNPVNDAPKLSGTISNQSATEGKAFIYTVPANIFSDIDGDSLTYSATQANGAALPSWLQFTPAFRFFAGTPPTNTADVSIRVTAKDAGGLSANADFNFSTPAAPITSHVPMAESRTIIINEDTSYTIKVADFGFSDPNDNPAHSFFAVKIGNLPGKGNLTFNHATSSGQILPVVSGQIIYTSDINAGRLVFTPGLNENSPSGEKYGSFTFRVQDNGAAGTNLSVIDNRLSFNVNAVNDAPSGTPTAILADGKEDTNYIIYASDLLKGFTDAERDTLTVINLTASNGKLVAGNGNWTFTPDANYFGVVALNYSVSDGKGGIINNATRNFTLVDVFDGSPGVTITPLQTPAITSEGNALVTGIAGGQATFSVVLNTQPTADVKITFTSNNPAEGKPVNGVLTFTPSNWNSAQTLTIQGQDDLLDDGDVAYVISGIVTSNDIDYYRGIAVPNQMLQNIGDAEDVQQVLSGDKNGIPTRDRLSGKNGSDKLYGLLDIDELKAGLGNDSLYGGYDDDFLYGENGDDKLYGEQDNDKLYGGDGSDTLDGGIGADLMVGGNGADVYYIDEEGDVIDDQGSDNAADIVIIPVAIFYTLGNTIENATLKGIDNSSLTGNELANLLTGNSGNNSISGAAGNDTLIGGPGNDTLQGGADLDSANYASATGAINADLTTGIATGDGNDILSEIENILSGAGNDTLIGNSGANNLTGGIGKDTLVGGLSADIFIYNSIQDSGVGSSIRDTISDFSSAQGDKIDLHLIGAKSFITGNFTNHAGEVRFDSANHLVQFDSNGDAQADFEIELTGVMALNATDLIFS